MEDFKKDKYKKSGRGSWCKKCHSRENIKRMKNNPLLAKEYDRRYTQKLRQDILAVLGDRCVICGFSDIRALQVDHIRGGGTAELREIGAKAIYRKIRNGNTEGYQLLCANCNWIKRHEMGENRK